MSVFVFYEDIDATGKQKGKDDTKRKAVSFNEGKKMCFRYIKKRECPAVTVGRFIVSTFFARFKSTALRAVYLPFDFVVASFFCSLFCLRFIFDACATGTCVFSIYSMNFEYHSNTFI